MFNKILYFIIIISFLFINCSHKEESRDDLGNSKNRSNKLTKSSTTFQEKVQEDITITTEDSKSISAYLFYTKEKKESSQPLVILIHQFKQSKEQWPNEFIDTLVNYNYKVFSYDIRGHGNSSKLNYELSKLLSDPDEAPKDLKAIFSWTKTQKGIDTSRMAVIGTSIGGNLACYGRYFLGAKTIIGISNGRKGFESFMEIDERLMGRVFPRISSVLFICGNKDGNHEADQKYIIDNYADDPKELKVYDSEKHGKYLLEEHPEIYTVLLNWLQKYL